MRVAPGCLDPACREQAINQLDDEDDYDHQLQQSENPESSTISW